jgi:hypothetical protein
MESEYIAMFSTSQQTIWLSTLESEFQPTRPQIPLIWCDNDAAIKIATGGDMSFKRSRFMNVKYHYVRLAYLKGEIKIEYVKSALNIADMFTKRLPYGPLKKQRNRYMSYYNELEVPVPSDTTSSPKTNSDEPVE